MLPVLCFHWANDHTMEYRAGALGTYHHVESLEDRTGVCGDCISSVPRYWQLQR